MLGWIYLAAAIVFEVIGTSCMKLSDGLTKLWPSVIMFVCYAFAFTGLALAIKQINVSVAYAIWAGLGIILITLIDIFIFKSHLGVLRLIAIGLIVIGAVALKVLPSQ